MQLSDDISKRAMEATKLPWWKPADPMLLRMLQKRYAAQNRRIVRWGLWAAVLSYLSYGIFDHFLFPDISERLILVRALVSVIFLGLLEVAARRGRALPYLHVIAAAAIFFGATGWLSP